MPEYTVEIPGGYSGWAFSLALVDEFVHSWRAEVQDYDVTPSGGVITLAVPDDLEFRIAATRAFCERVCSHLALSDAIVHSGRNRVAEARARLAEIASHLAA